MFSTVYCLHCIVLNYSRTGTNLLLPYLIMCIPFHISTMCSSEHTPNLGLSGLFDFSSLLSLFLPRKTEIYCSYFQKEESGWISSRSFTHPMSRTLQIVVIAWTLCLVNVWEDAGARLINTYLPK